MRTRGASRASFFVESGLWGMGSADAGDGVRRAAEGKNAGGWMTRAENDARSRKIQEKLRENRMN